LSEAQDAWLPTLSWFSEPLYLPQKRQHSNPFLPLPFLWRCRLWSRWECEKRWWCPQNTLKSYLVPTWVSRSTTWDHTDRLATTIIIISNMKNKSYWFTLIETIVAVTILGVVMISIFATFLLASDINNKTDISRSMQENIKNIVEIISEDIRKNGISGVNDSMIDPACDFWDDKVLFRKWTKLCVGNNSYYLAKKVSDIYIRISDISECQKWDIQCTLIRHDQEQIDPLSNSWIDFQEINFYVSNVGQKKVVVQFIVRPSTKKWISPELIKHSTLQFETTLSEQSYHQ